MLEILGPPKKTPWVEDRDMRDLALVDHSITKVVYPVAYPAQRRRGMGEMHFLSPWQTAHPAGPVTFMNTSIPSIDYVYSADSGSLHLPTSPAPSLPPTQAFLLSPLSEHSERVTYLRNN